MIQNHPLLHGITDQMPGQAHSWSMYQVYHKTFVASPDYDMSGVCKNDRSILTDVTSHEWSKPCRKLKEHGSPTACRSR